MNKDKRYQPRDFPGLAHAFRLALCADLNKRPALQPKMTEEERNQHRLKLGLVLDV